MDTDPRALVERLHREEVERIQAGGAVPPSDRPARPEKGLPEAEPGSPIAAEWEIFRREVDRLIREGGRGRIALVQIGQPITVWDTLRDALQARRLVYGPGPCLIQEIQRYIRPVRLEPYRSCRA